MKNKRTNGCISLATLKDSEGNRATGKGNFWCESASNPDNDNFVITYEYEYPESNKYYTIMKFEVAKNGSVACVQTEHRLLSYRDLDSRTWAKLYEEQITSIERRMLNI